MLDKLEELLSITERFKKDMNKADRRQWQAISVECADRRSALEAATKEQLIERFWGLQEASIEGYSKSINTLLWCLNVEQLRELVKDEDDYVECT